MGWPSVVGGRGRCHLIEWSNPSEAWREHPVEETSSNAPWPLFSHLLNGNNARPQGCSESQCKNPDSWCSRPQASRCLPPPRGAWIKPIPPSRAVPSPSCLNSSSICGPTWPPTPSLMTLLGSLSCKLPLQTAQIGAGVFPISLCTPRHLLQHSFSIAPSPTLPRERTRM